MYVPNMYVRVIYLMYYSFVLLVVSLLGVDNQKPLSQ